MRAAILAEPGDIPAVAEHPGPDLRPGRSLVRVTAAHVVPLDVLCGSGTSYFGRPATPYVPGVQGVGRVEQSAVLPAGTRVWFATVAGMAPGDGSLAELCSVADDDLVAVDAVIEDAAVASLGLSAVAAWMSLTWRAGLRSGERVVVLEHGRLVNLGGSGGDVATFSSSTLRSRSISLLGYTNNALTVQQRAEALTSVVGLAAAGRMRVAHTVNPLDLVGEVWSATAAGRAAPRAVLLPGAAT